VFLSNRAAALLSLKRYTAAATDARRAIALAPTFGKAHARLGQALYFQKQYAGAVAAYEDAIRFEPDNDVTVTYLEKAKAKQEKHAAKQQQQQQQQQHTSARNKQAQAANYNNNNNSTSSSKGSGSGSINNKSNNSNNDVDSGGELRSGGGGGEGEADAATQFTTSANQSVTTTDHQQTSIITGRGGGWRGRNNPAVLKAAQAQQLSQRQLQEGSSNHSSQQSSLSDGKQERGRQADNSQTPANINKSNDQDAEQQQEQHQTITADPDFHEALRIQQRANRYLAKKEYKAAIEEYTAALFLVPDDAQLSPDLHLGRAHALNGSRRHESARNDCILAIRLVASPENAAPAYSTLAKSLFYMKDYHGSVEAFYQCMELLQAQGETLGMFDKAYLQKAEAALEEEAASLNISGKDAHHRGGASVSSKSSSVVVPKLPPPRFVPREEAIQKAPSIPSMPKQWQQAQKQLPTSPCALKCGPERSIIFYSEALGIKLNRGPDGMVRVLSVAPNTPASPVAKSGGDIQMGDIVREAAGVDIRRPITNVMWGDTVRLLASVFFFFVSYARRLVA
jgi:tetratricopeptide (TPR) repeat protein